MQIKKFGCIRIEGSDNGGVVLTYDEKVKDGKGHYDNWNTTQRTLTYKNDEIPAMVTKITELITSTVELKDKEEEEKEGTEIEITIPSQSY